MFYVGIDIAKLTHYASIVNSDGEILVKPFAFTNDHNGFQKLLGHLNSLPNQDGSGTGESTEEGNDNPFNGTIDGNGSNGCRALTT